MGTPRLSEPVDQMRNVQRTASCGEELSCHESLERDCRFEPTQRGRIALVAVTAVALNPNPISLLANSCEAGALFLVEVAQQDLFAQQPGLHAFCTGESETIQARAEAPTGAAISEVTIINEIAIRLSIGD